MSYPVLSSADATEHMSVKACFILGTAEGLKQAYSSRLSGMYNSEKGQKETNVYLAPNTLSSR